MDETQRDPWFERPYGDTGRTHIDRTAPDVDETYRDIAPPDGGGTRPDGGGTRPDGRDAAGGTRHDGQAPPDGVTLRFGPGVPAEVAERWRRGSGRNRRSVPRRILGGFVTVAIAVLAGLAVWWLMRGGGPAVRATGISVRVPAGVQRCDSTVLVVGTIRTNGGHGDVSYRWRRSDGQATEVFTQRVDKGQHSLDVTLRWTVQGTGSLRAVATLELIAPQGSVTTASGAFDYSCG